MKNNTRAIQIGGYEIQPDEFMVMAGPCSIESKPQIFAIAEQVSRLGATFLRGGAFKPRTSPYDFQGLGNQGLHYLREAAAAFGLLSVSEVMDHEQLAYAEELIDVLQIGARNMQNISLLKAVGKSKKPVLLKRGHSATYKEFLCAAEYILSSGNPNVILCERGIRTFEHYTRNTLDIAAVPILKQMTHLPIIIDPSHGVGIRRAVPHLANAAIAAGANGVLVEVHTHPEESISDADQTISVEEFAQLMKTMRQIAPAVGMQFCSEKV